MPQKFTSKLPGPAEGKKGEKFLEILVFKMEAEWAYAMDMKKAISQQEGATGEELEAQKAKQAAAGIKNQSQFN